MSDGTRCKHVATWYHGVIETKSPYTETSLYGATHLQRGPPCGKLRPNKMQHGRSFARNTIHKAEMSDGTRSTKRRCPTEHDANMLQHGTMVSSKQKVHTARQVRTEQATTDSVNLALHAARTRCNMVEVSHGTRSTKRRCPTEHDPQSGDVRRNTMQTCCNMVPWYHRNKKFIPQDKYVLSRRPPTASILRYTPPERDATW